jgi:hypothetical protein
MGVAWQLPGAAGGRAGQLADQSDTALQSPAVGYPAYIHVYVFMVLLSDATMSFKRPKTLSKLRTRT